MSTNEVTGPSGVRRVEARPPPYSIDTTDWNQCPSAVKDTCLGIWSAPCTYWMCAGSTAFSIGICGCIFVRCTVVLCGCAAYQSGSLNSGTSGGSHEGSAGVRWEFQTSTRPHHSLTGYVRIRADFLQPSEP